MNRANLEEAMAIAEQFIRRGEILCAAEKTGHFYGSKESGDVRRISMELTRSLATLRKP